MARPKAHHFTEPTPISTQIDRCTYPGCGKRIQIPEFTPLCVDHAALIHERFKAALDERNQLVVNDARIQRRERERKQAEAERQTRRSQPGVVYYLRIDSKIKIGYTANIRHRMRQYPPTAHLLAVEPGTPDDEVRVHRQFEAFRSQGREWFDESPELAEHVATVVAEHGDPARFQYRMRPARPVQPLNAGERKIKRRY